MGAIRLIRARRVVTVGEGVADREVEVSVTFGQDGKTGTGQAKGPRASARAASMALANLFSGDSSHEEKDHGDEENSSFADEADSMAIEFASIAKEVERRRARMQRRSGGGLPTRLW